MADIPVKCVRCGETGFSSNLIGGDGSVTNLQMTNVTLGGACPKCGGDMRVIDGTYNITNGVVTAFRALGATQLKDMQSILRGSRAGKLTAEAATEQAAAISPDMAALVAALQRQPQWTAPVIVNTLLAVLAVVLAWMALHQTSALQLQPSTDSTRRLIPCGPPWCADWSILCSWPSVRMFVVARKKVLGG